MVGRTGEEVVAAPLHVVLTNERWRTMFEWLTVGCQGAVSFDNQIWILSISLDLDQDLLKALLCIAHICTQRQPFLSRTYTCPTMWFFFGNFRVYFWLFFCILAFPIQSSGEEASGAPKTRKSGIMQKKKQQRGGFFRTCWGIKKKGRVGKTTGSC